MKLIRKFHRHRVGDVQKLMNDILKTDFSNDQYRGTFVLDHSPDCSHFQLHAKELTEQCAEVIVRRLQC